MNAKRYLISLKEKLTLFMAFVMVVSVLEVIPSVKVKAINQSSMTECTSTETNITQEVTTTQEATETNTTQEVMTTQEVTEIDTTQEVTTEQIIEKNGMEDENPEQISENINAEAENANTYFDEAKIEERTIPENPDIPKNATDKWSGDYVYYGMWNKKSIKWRVLQNDGEYLLLMTDSGIESIPYRDVNSYTGSYSDKTDNIYANSTIRAWLNNTFFTMAFSPEEQDEILVNNVENGFSSTSKYDSGPNTEDKVYALSFKEFFNPAYGFWGENENSASRVFWYKAPYGNLCAESIWTRTMYEIAQYAGTPFAVWVNENGGFSSRGSWYTHPTSWSKYVHPVIKIPIASQNWKNYIDVDAPEDACLKLKSVEYFYNGITKNLLQEAHSIEPSHKNFRLSCVVVKRSAVKKYVLYSGETVIAESTNGIFEDVDPSKFKEGDTVSVEIVGKNRKITTNLLLEIKEKNVLTKGAVKIGGDAVSVTLSDDVPLFGGSELSYSLPELPVNAVVEDGKIRIGFNIKEKELYAENSTSGVTTTTTNKTFSQKVSDWKHDILKKKMISQDIKGYLEQADIEADMPAVSKKTKVTVFGYVEGTWSDSIKNFDTLSGEMVFAITASTSLQAQTMFFSVPVTCNIKITGEGEIVGKVTYDFAENEIYGDLGLDFSVSLEPYVGVGAGTWISGGAYGKGTVGIEISLIKKEANTDIKGPGLESVYLDGELGLKAYLAKKELKIPLVYITSPIYIYSRDDKESGKYESNLPVLKSSGVEKINEYFSLESSAKTTTSEQLNSEQCAENILVSHAYGAASPQMATIDNKVIYAYIGEDEEREVANQTVAQFLVYDKKTDTYSSVNSIFDDGTADFDLHLYSDGNDIYAYYLDSNTVYGQSEDPDISNYASSFKVTVTKFDSSTNQFEKICKVSLGDHYCYSPSVYSKGDELIVAWAENEDDQVFGLSENNSIGYVICNEKRVSEPICLKTNMNCITSVVVGKKAEEYSIAYSVDEDNDLNTNIEQLYINDLSGENKLVDTSYISNISYNKLPDTNEEVFIMVRDGILSYLDKDNNLISIDNVNIEMGSSYQIVGNNIYYLENSEESSRNVSSYIYNNGQYTDVVITNEKDYVDAFATDGENIIYIVTTASNFQSNGFETESQIKLINNFEKHDISLDYVDFDGYLVEKGKDLPITLGIINKGTEQVDEILVECNNKAGETILSKTVSVNAAPGTSFTETLYFTVPNNIDEELYEIRLSELNVEDQNLEDNTSSLDLSLTDVSVDMAYIVKGGTERYIRVTLKNNSCIDTDISMIVTDDNGNSICDITENIVAKEMIKHDIKLTEEMMPKNDSDMIYNVNVSTNTQEYYECNNKTSIRIWDINPVSSVAENINNMDDEKDNSGTIKPSTTESHTTVQPARPKPSQNQTLPAVGTQITSSSAVYKVTKSSSSQKEVTYVKPKSKKKASVSIPDTIKISGFTYKVTSVSANALSGNKKVTKITVGKNVTSIGKNAFKKCTKLKTVTLKSTSLKSIGSNAFYGDKNLKTITIKSSKLTSKSVGKNAFKGTNKKLTIKVPKKKVSSYKKFLKKKGNSKVKVKKG